MKKIAMFLVVLLAAAPAMAVVTVTATQVGTSAEVDITAAYSGGGAIPRAYALDITVDSGQSIDSISNFFSGEGKTAGKGYGIFPANFNRFIDADDPCWGEPNYTPVADVNDLPGDTQGGLGTAGITIEMGSLYKGANSPPSPSTLCRIEVSGDCNVGLLLNVGRGKIVLEDGNDANTPPSSVTLTGCHVAIICTVPNVYDMTEAAACTAIEDAGFVCDTTTLDDEYHDSIVAGNIISQDIVGVQTCGSTVKLVTSLGPCIVPDVIGDPNATAQAAIIAAGFNVSVSADCCDTVAAGNVFWQNPSGSATPGCGTTVSIKVSTGPCVACANCGDLDGNGLVQFADTTTRSLLPPTLKIMYFLSSITYVSAELNVLRTSAKHFHSAFLTVLYQLFKGDLAPWCLTQNSLSLALLIILTSTLCTLFGKKSRKNREIPTNFAKNAGCPEPIKTSMVFPPVYHAAFGG